MREEWSDAMINKIKKAMASHSKKSYCEYLKSQGKLSSCEFPPEGSPT